MSVGAYVMLPGGTVSAVTYPTWPDRRVIAAALGVPSVQAMHVYLQLALGGGPTHCHMYVSEAPGGGEYNTWASLVYQQASLWCASREMASKSAIYGPAMLMMDNHDDWLSTHQTDAFEEDYIEDSRRATKLFEKLRGER